MFPFITVDFESEQILPRPRYPPRPCGVALKWPGKKGLYYAWGHPTQNNCSYDEALLALAEAWDSYRAACGSSDVVNALKALIYGDLPVMV